MAINVTGYLPICEYSISDYTQRLSKQGKALRNAFKSGPSKSVASDGIVIVDTNIGSDKDTENNTENNKENDTVKEEPKNNVQSTQETDTNSNKESSSDKGNESYNYSILEAYLNLNKHIICEEDADDSSNKDSSGEQSDTASQDTKAGDNSDNKDKEADDSNDKKFNPGPELYIKSEIKGEGCTVWHIQLDSRADKDAVIKAIKSKNFKSADIIAGKGLGGISGITVLSAKTYISKNADVHVPFIGNCRYAMDSGSEDAAEDSDTVCIAVAPIDGRTGKPNEKTVFKATYNIIGDISDGGDLKPILKDLKSPDWPAPELKFKDNTEDGDGEVRDTSISEVVSKWLHSKFKCVGDQSMFDNFNKLREFVSKQASAGNLEYNSEDSDTPLDYSKNADVKKSFIYY